MEIPHEAPEIKSTVDTDRRRATYLTNYPTECITLTKKREYKTLFPKSKSEHFFEVTSTDIVIEHHYESIKNTNFNICRFYVEEKSTSIEKITFRNCNFNKCFLGTIEYREVRFENCNFYECDFMNARFIGSTFDKSKFERCSAFNSYFENTEIPPKNFFHAFQFNKKNYENTHATRAEINEERREHRYAEFNISKNIYRSNNESCNPMYIDDSLYYLKKAEFSYLRDCFWHKDDEFNAVRLNFFSALRLNHKQVVGLLWRGFNLATTKGGTSLGRLVLILMSLVAMFNIYFSGYSGLHVSFMPNMDSNTDILTFFSWLPCTLSIFLAFGFTSFTPSTSVDFYFLVSCATFGLIWYSLLISTILRKIYR